MIRASRKIQIWFHSLRLQTGLVKVNRRSSALRLPSPITKQAIIVRVTPQIHLHVNINPEMYCLTLFNFSHSFYKNTLNITFVQIPVIFH